MNPASLQQQLATGMLGGSSPMNVATQGSPTYQPDLQPPSPTPMPNQSFQMAQQPAAQGASQQPQQAGQEQQITLPIQDNDPQAQGIQMSPQQLSEAERIIEALNHRMKNISAVEKMQQEAQMPPQPTGGM